MPRAFIRYNEEMLAVASLEFHLHVTTSQPHEILSEQSKLFRSWSGQGSRGKGQVTGTNFWDKDRLVFLVENCSTQHNLILLSILLSTCNRNTSKKYYSLRTLCKTSKFNGYRLVSERTRQVIIEQTQFLSTPFLCSEIKLENIYFGLNFCRKNV